MGEERILAERNRRDRLSQASESAAQAEIESAAGTGAAPSPPHRPGRSSAREAPPPLSRAAVDRWDELARSSRRHRRPDRAPAQCPRRRPAPGRRSQLTAELAAERRSARAGRARAQPSALRRIDGLAGAPRNATRSCCPPSTDVLEALAGAGEAIVEQRARIESELVGRPPGRGARGRRVAHRAPSRRRRSTPAWAARTRPLTETEVRLQRSPRSAADAAGDVREIAATLELEPAPRSTPSRRRGGARTLRRARACGAPARAARTGQPAGPGGVRRGPRARRGSRAPAHRPRDGAARAGETLIGDTDRQIHETFERTFAAAAASFEELAEQLFPGGKGRLRLVTERDGPGLACSAVNRRRGGAGFRARGRGRGNEDADVEPSPDEKQLGVEIELTPAGKRDAPLAALRRREGPRRDRLPVRALPRPPSPFYLLDEVEAALDDTNIGRFTGLLRTYAGGRSSSSSPTRSARWRPPTSSTASRWAPTASPRSSRAGSARHRRRAAGVARVAADGARSAGPVHPR